MKEDDLNTNFSGHTSSLQNIYDNASLDEKHKLNERIKFILDTHKKADTDFIKKKLHLNKIAVFGKPGGGKSTLSKQLSFETGIKLYPLDLIVYKKDGQPVSPDEYSKKHADLIANENWIIDGFGTLESLWIRIDTADILIYVDLPYYVHYWWVTKRLFKSFFVKPEGWPEGSSILKGTLTSWKNLQLSPKFWTPELFEEIKMRGKGKELYRITSIKELNNFTQQLVQAET